MTTEAEAKIKHCPFARNLVTIETLYRDLNIGKDSLIITVATAANRFQDNKVALCLGSGCMAWRWRDNGFKWFGNAPRPLTDPKNPQGYCGAAGPTESYNGEG